MISGKILLAIAILFLVGQCWAQATKPAVEVIFTLVENGYRKQIGAQISTIERIARDKLLRDLNDRDPFLRFTADPQDIILRVLLGSPNAGSEMHAVNFQISLEGQDSVTNRPLHSPTLIWPYRSATAYDAPLGSATALGTEIAVRFQQGDHYQLVSKVLRIIPLTHEGLLVQSNPQPIWVIPFTQEDLCMDFPSYLEIEDAYHTDTGDRSDRFRVKANGLHSSANPRSTATLQQIEGVPADPPPFQTSSLQDLESSAKEQNTVKGVFVLQYSRKRPCSDIVQPPTFAPTGGSR